MPRYNVYTLLNHRLDSRQFFELEQALEYAATLSKPIVYDRQLDGRLTVLKDLDGKLHAGALHAFESPNYYTLTLPETGTRFRTQGQIITTIPRNSFSEEARQ